MLGGREVVLRVLELICHPHQGVIKEKTTIIPKQNGILSFRKLD